MKSSKSQQKRMRKQRLTQDEEETRLLTQWIDSQKPEPGTNPLSLLPLPPNSPVGRLQDGSFSPYAAATKFSQLPLSKKTKDGLKKSQFFNMTEIQRASLPHALFGRDVLGAAKTGSGKTLAFIIPVLERLHMEGWGPQFGVASIIISPTRELAGQLFEVLKTVGRFHNFSAGLLIGGRKDVDTEKERVNQLNILVCTPGRLLQHMDETPLFDCSELKVLVLDEADRILDTGFQKTLNAIISQLPKHRQTMLFSATQTKSVKDLARLSLKDPEYLSVHEEAVTATPNRLQQTAMIVPIDQKLDMLWSFIKAHLNSKILVFLSSCKQVRFVFEAFRKLRPGIPLRCLHGRMKQETRMAIYSDFCEKTSVLFSTDVASRGLDFNKAVDWVIQVDCPENVASYIHRVGRTARYLSGGRSVMFVMPSEMKMLEKLKAAKIPIEVIKANQKKLQLITGKLSALLAQDKDIQYLATRAFITYVRSIHIQKDKDVFDVLKLPMDEFSASLGLPMTPKIRFLGQKIKKLKADKSSKSELVTEEVASVGHQNGPDISELKEEVVQKKKKILVIDVQEVDNDLFHTKEETNKGDTMSEIGDTGPATRVLKKKKLKINIHRPVGTRFVFDEGGHILPPLARVADATHTEDAQLLDQDKREEYYGKMREEMKEADKEDKLLYRQRCKEKRIKEKAKWKKGIAEEEYGSDEDDLSDTDAERSDRKPKRKKIYFNSDDDDEDGETVQKRANVEVNTDSISLAEQEALALKLLSSMHS